MSRPAEHRHSALAADDVSRAAQLYRRLATGRPSRPVAARARLDLVPAIAPTAPSTSRYAGLSRGPALALAAALLATMGWFLWCNGLHRAPPLKSVPPQQQDAELYRSIVERVAAGQGYYEAAGAELRARHYPTRPMFNWRQPTYAIVLSHLPQPSLVLGLVMLAALGASLRWIRRAWGPRPALAVTVLHVGALLFGLDLYYFQEVWAGSLIILSLSLYANGRWRLGALTLLAALSFREFVVLPCGVALLLALKERRWSEVRVWLVGLSIYAALMLLHGLAVTRHLTAADLASTPRSWVAFGGPRFLVSACRFGAFFFFLPPGLTALLLPLSLFGYGGWRDPGATRMGLTLASFLVVFAVIGQWFNIYWGFLFLSLLSVGLARAPIALRDLAAAIVRPRPRAATAG